MVYQAYRPSIGHFAINHGCLGGQDFSLGRMSWIKPNFLWMMYRSGWGTKPGQEIILGLRIRRTFFESILEQAVPSTPDSKFQDHSTWKSAVSHSEVRVQWDPDHSPSGAKLHRRAIQLGLRGQVLEAFSKRELLEVINMTEFVASQRSFTQDSDVAELRVPRECVYTVESIKARERIGLDQDQL